LNGIGGQGGNSKKEQTADQQHDENIFDQLDDPMLHGKYSFQIKIIYYNTNRND
jgi:hypothetical protein